jgi:hypothetical protein
MKVNATYHIKVDYVNEDEHTMKLLIYSDKYKKTPEGYEEPHDPYLFYDCERWCMDDNESTRELAFILMQHSKNPQTVLQFLWDNPDVEILLG